MMVEVEMMNGDMTELTLARKTYGRLDKVGVVSEDVDEISSKHKNL